MVSSFTRSVAFVLVISCVFWTSPALAEEYEQMVRARGRAALTSGDVNKLMESAFALYPLERGADKPLHRECLHKASKIVIDKGSQKAAAAFLQSSGPLFGELPNETRKSIQEQAVGKSLEDIAKEGASQARRPISAIGPDIVDPDIKTRGEADRKMSMTLGHGILAAARPSTILADSGNEPQMTDHQLEFPKANRCTIRIGMRWYGVFTETPYDSQIAVRFLVVDDSLEILGVDYTDDCLFPAPEMRAIQAFVNELNATLN